MDKTKSLKKKTGDEIKVQELCIAPILWTAVTY